ncbi:MAG: acylphosphatase [Chlamydiales bacterium]
MNEKRNLQLHAIFKGRVQGVGFRWTIQDCADRFDVTGTTKNLKDGTVEVYAQGSKEILERFLEAIKNDPGSARIEHISCRYQEPSALYEGFTIVF